MNLRQAGFTNSACGPFTKKKRKKKKNDKIKKKYNNLKKQKIRGIFIKMNQIKFVFNLTRLESENMMDIKGVLPQLFRNVLIKKPLAVD